jgi:hypothetical protein
MKIALIHIIFCLFTSSLEQPIYKQQVTLQKSIFQSVRGEIRIGKDSIQFVPNRPRNKALGFSIAKNQLRSVKKVRAYIAPNRLLLQTIDSRYTLYTYKRKKLRENLLLR